MWKSSASIKRIYALCLVPAFAIAILVISHFLTTAKKSSASGAGSASRATSVRAISPAAQRRMGAHFAALPTGFERNEGQAEPDVKYIARGAGYKLSLTSSEAVLTLHRRGGDSGVRAMVEDKRLGPAKVQKMLRQRKTSAGEDFAMVRMQLRGANADAQVDAEDEQPGKVNYFLGKDSAKWQTNVPLYGRVRYRNLYPGVDLAFHGYGQQLEFDYLLKPGANVGAIELGFGGAPELKVNAKGDLVLGTRAGSLEMKRPVAYQEKNGERQVVEARFEVRDARRVGFVLGAYDRTRELIIDPTIVYSTYFGGESADYGMDIVADSSGNAFVAGATDSTSLPDSVSGTNSGSFDVFVTKINSAGVLQFTSVFGGSGDEFPGFPNALAIDSSGIYLAGTTDSSDFPVTAGAAQTTFQGGSANGNNDAFAAKLSLDGTSITWATYIGGNDSDSGLGLAVDGSENVYVVGETYSTNLPVKNALPSGSALNLGKNTTDDDGYIAALNSAGSSFSLVSYIGGSSGDIASAVTLDSTGNAYVTGATISTDLPVTSGVVQSTLNGSSADDIFVGAIAAKSFTAANFVPGATKTAHDNWPASFPAWSLEALLVPLMAVMLLAGFWYGASTTNRKLVPALPSVGVTLMLILMPACGGSGSGSKGGGGGGGGGGSSTAYNYFTYYGGSNADEGIAIAVDSSGDAYVTGQTASSNFPVSSTTYQSTLAGAQNAFLLELNPTGSAAKYASYLGGNGTDYGIGIYLDGNGNVYLTGQTTSTNFPAVAATQANFGGSTDAFVSVLNPGSNSLVFSTYLGGAGDEDQLAGSVYGGSTGFYVTGDTTSGNGTTAAFPTVSPLDPAWASGGSCVDSSGTAVPCPDGFITAYTAVQ